MRFFDLLSIKGKILAAFAVGIFVIILTALISLYSLSITLKLEKEVRNINNNMTGTITVNNAYNKVHRWMHDIQLKPSPQLVQEGKEHLNNLNNIYQNLPDGLFPNLAADTRDKLKKLIEVTNMTFMDLLEQGKYAQADEVFLHEVLPYLSGSNMNISKLVNQYNNNLGISIAALNIKDAMYTIVGATLIGIILTLIVALFIARYLVMHTLRIKQTALKIESGDFALNLNLHKIPSDEIGDIYRSFISISETLTNTIARVIAVSKKIHSISSEVHSSAQSISEGSKSAENQSVSVATSADEMVATTSDIANNCHVAKESSEDTKRETKIGVYKVRLSVAKIKEQSLQTHEDAQKVLRLAEQSQKIASIVNTIDDIAAQTNLLALNAAIEAARAGETGRGFAVVADEVRALASRTSKSTQEISSMVNTVQIDSKEATDSMQDSVVQMEQMAASAGELEDTLNNILNLVDNVNSQIAHIAISAERQTDVISEISNNMQNITKMAQQSVDVSSAQYESSAEAASLVSTLLEELKFFKIDQNIKADIRF